jgi:hypothetical protein
MILDLSSHTYGFCFIIFLPSTSKTIPGSFKMGFGSSSRSLASSLFWPILISNFVLSALSISNLGLISSMVGWLLNQKHNVHRYLINAPGTPFSLNFEPAHLWVDQGHTSNGVAGYGFFLGLFGMIVAWRIRKATVCSHSPMLPIDLTCTSNLQNSSQLFLSFSFLLCSSP